MESRPDQRIERAKRGDEAAWSSIIAEVERDLLAYCRKFVVSPEDARDAVSEAFARAWRYRETFTGDSSDFRRWIFRIARNSSVDIMKSTLKSKQIPLDSAEPRALASNDAPLHDHAYLKGLRSRLVAWARSLPTPWDDTDVTIYWLRCEEQETFAEIAQRCGMSEIAVKQRFHRKIITALRKFQEEEMR